MHCRSIAGQRVAIVRCGLNSALRPHSPELPLLTEKPTSPACRGMSLKRQQRTSAAGSCRDDRTLFRENRFAHALYVPGAIFWPTKWRHDISRIRDARPGIEALLEPPHLLA